MKELNEQIRKLEVLVDIIESDDLSNGHFRIIEDAVNQIKLAASQ